MKLRVRLIAAIGVIAGLCAVVAPAGPTTAAADLNMVPLVPARLMETRSSQPVGTVDNQHEGVGEIAAGSVYTLDVAGRGGVVPGADAVMLNVTAVRPDREGYLTLFPCTPEVPHASNVNYFAGDVSPNSVLAKLSDDGEVCIFSYGTTHVVVDVTGYVPAGGAPVPVDPARLVETRVGPLETTVDGLYEGIGRADPGEIVRFQVAGRGNVPSGTPAVYLNVTAIRPSSTGWLTVYPCTATVPGSSNVNYVAGDIAPNAVLATLSPAGEVCIYTTAASDIIADVNAYLPEGGNRVATEPERCADTRPEGETFDGLFEGDGKIEAGDTYQVQIAGRCNIADDASAAYLNVTAVNAEAIGYLTVWPCDEPRPGTSNVNYQPGPAQPNSVLAKISLDGNGNICIYSQARTDVIVDANGYVPAAGWYGIEQLAAGGRTTCVLLNDGTVRCAGERGYTGDGTFGEDYPLVGGTYDPVQVVGIDDAVLVEAGESSTCAVLADTTARCWGRNNFGQLGDGTDVGTDGNSFDRRHSPVQVGGLDGIMDISIWAEHTCAITDDDDDGTGDTAWCWGRNNYRQLGDGTTEDRFSPVEVQGLPAGVAPVDIETGSNHTCLLLADETVTCWGSGGKVGRGPSLGSAGQPPQVVPGLTGVDDLAVGRNHTCVVLAGGSVSCWGQDDDHALGDHDPAVENGDPAAVEGVTGAVDVTASHSSTCVRYGDGTAECWGANQYGQLGDGSPDPDGELEPVPMLTGSDADITAVSSNGLWWCALLADASAVCWGYYNGDGGLGVALQNHTSTPVVYGSGDHRP